MLPQRPPTATAADNAALLSGLLDTDDAPQLVTVAAAAPATQRAERTAPAVQRTERAHPRQKPAAAGARQSWRANGAYDKLGSTGALVSALLFAAALWALGAYYSIAAVTAWAPGLVSSAGPAIWALPVAISLVELWLWPSGRPQRALLPLWLLTLAFDIGSSASGLFTALGGRHVALFAGYDIPTGGWQLWALALSIAVALAFGPERLGRNASAGLMELWS